MDIQQLRDFIVTPALGRIDLWSPAADQLVIGTALHESKLEYIDQLAPGPGPAYGLFQMERVTHDDLWRNFIPAYPKLRAALLDIAGRDSAAFPPVEELHGNNFYAAAMCRVAYRRVPAALPAAGDALAMSVYWKRYYNTALGKGTVEQALPSFQRACSLSLTS